MTLLRRSPFIAAALFIATLGAAAQTTPDRYLKRVDGAIVDAVPNTTSAGSADSGKIVALNPSGQVDSSMLPSLGGSAYYGNASATCSGGETVITMGSVPLAGSVQIKLNGVAIDPAQITVTGSSAFLGGGFSFSAGDVVSATWETANATPGGISVSTSAGGIRAFAVTGNPSGSTSNQAFTFPGTAAAGDLAIIFFAWPHGSMPTTPTGWTKVGGNTTYTWWGGAVYSKVLNSGDIAAGSVTFATTSDPWNGAIVVMVGNSTPIEELVWGQNVISPAALTTSSAPLMGNIGLYFASQLSGTAGSATFDRGSQIGTHTDTTNNTTVLYSETLAANGSITPHAVYSPQAGAFGTYYDFQAVVIMSTAPVTPGVIPEVDQSQVKGLTAALASAPTSLTTTGTSGAATLAGGNLNIPVYSGGGGGGSVLLLEQHTASNSASLQFTTSISSSYDEYLIEFINLQVTSGGANIYLRFSTNGGSTYDTSSIYSWGQANTSLVSGGNGNNNQSSVSAIVLWATSSGGGPPTSANPGFNASLKLYDPLSTSQYKAVFGLGMSVYSGNSQPYLFTTGGFYANSTAVNAFEILASAGNLASGIVRVYGLTH